MASASTSETSCTAISGRAPGSTSRSSVLRSTWLRVSKPSPNNWAEPCCCPARSPTSSRAISISNVSANIRCAASTTQSSYLRITAECRSVAGCRTAPKGRELSERPLSANVGFRWLLVRDWRLPANKDDAKNPAIHGAAGIFILKSPTSQDRQRRSVVSNRPARHAHAARLVVRITIDIARGRGFVGSCLRHFAPDLPDDRIKRRREQETECGHAQHACKNRRAQRLTHFRAGARCDHERRNAEDERQ